MHVCGEPAAEHVLKALIKSTGDDLEVRQDIFSKIGHFRTGLLTNNIISLFLMLPKAVVFNFLAKAEL